MSTIVTPSAKSHERVTGRWLQDIQVQTRREWAVYYLKVVIGTPIPWLLVAYACLIFLSRAGLEIAAWACAALTAVYIIADRFSRTKEFRFFRVGYDFFLLGYVLVGILSALFSDSVMDGFATLGGVRWVLLLYLITYCWELFPGLNRIYYIMVGMASLTAGYGIWQHFTGVDLIRGTAVPSAPIAGHIYFMASSFLNTPEIFGTLLGMILPFPVAAFLLFDRRDSNFERWLSLGVSLLLSLGILWTYRPGIWIAAGAGTLVTIILHGRNALTLLTSAVAYFAIIFFVFYSSPENSMKSVFDGVKQSEVVRGETQRAQINSQVHIWLHQDETPKSIWLGAGNKAVELPNYDPGTGNIYFQVLAQSGVLGAGFYLLFLLGFLLATYRAFNEVPKSHYWHRVLLGGALGGQIAFHVAGLYWSTLSEAHAINLFVMIAASVSYLSEHYGRGLVTDDACL
jgi:hypothetical protein